MQNIKLEGFWHVVWQICWMSMSRKNRNVRQKTEEEEEDEEIVNNKKNEFPRRECDIN